MRRLLLSLLAFVGLLALAIVLSPSWRLADYRLLGRVLQAHAPPAPADVLLLELPDPGLSAPDFRRLLGGTLRQLARRAPARVLVDVNVSEGDGAAEVATGITALQAAGSRVFQGLLPDDANSGTLARAVYDDAPLAGVGHTALHLGAGLAFYDRIYPVTAQGIERNYLFLPLLLSARPEQVEQGMAVIAVPDPGTGLPSYRVAADGALPAALPASLAGNTVLVASSQRECRQGVGDMAACGPDGQGWTSPQLLYWALVDVLAGPHAEAPRPITDAPTQLAVALCAAAAALAAHLGALRLAVSRWSPRQVQQRLWLVDAGAFAVALGLLALLLVLVLQANRVLPVTLSVIATALALGLCHLHARRNLAEMLWLAGRRASSTTAVADIDVFISYSHEPGNAAWVERELVAPLQALRGADGLPLRLFFDRDSIEVGQDWFQRINLSLLGSRCLLCIWSDDYHLRDYCRWELEYGFRRAADPRFLFLPVLRLAPGAALDGYYAPFAHARQYVDATALPAATAQVLDRIRAHLGLAAGPPAN